jgi:hypothetical protein
MRKMEEVTECLKCGSALVEIGGNLVNGRQMNPKELICPDCWGRCPECGDWYRQGEDCPKHPDAELMHNDEAS